MKVHLFSLFEYIIEELYVRDELQNVHYTSLKIFYYAFMCFFLIFICCMADLFTGMTFHYGSTQSNIYMLYCRFIHSDGCVLIMVLLNVNIDVLIYLYYFFSFLNIVRKLCTCSY